MMQIRIDGKYYKVNPQKNLLENCLANGLNIPHFCFHPALGSVGACRLCAVKKFKDAQDSKGRIVMSCMEAVTDGMIISTGDEDVKQFRAAVIEGLMINHPHDCPVCDEGGECHLQDMTVMTGHNYRRFDFRKRTYNDQELGPFINHEMNRCIQCYRCVRFYRDYAGGRDLNVFGAHNHIYFGRHENGTLESEFSGNLVEVCPTGVFTDKTLKKHFTRKWDLSNSPSICVHCSAGCNIIASERYGSLRRIMNRYNGAVNGYFICDRGRFGYEFVNDDRRIRHAEIRLKKDGDLKVADPEELRSKLEQAWSTKNKIIGIGSPRASLESNFALSVLAGKENFYHGISEKEHHLTKTAVDFLKNSGIMTPSMKQMEKADVVLILGEDLTNTAPMIALAIRQAARNVTNEAATLKGIPLWNDAPVRELAQDDRSPVFIATAYKDSLDDIAEIALRASYKEISNLGFSVASLINAEAPRSAGIDEDHQNIALRIAESLKQAKNPLVITGINHGDEEVLHSSFNIVTALQQSGTKAMLSVVLPESNSMGLALVPGKPLEDAFALAAEKEIDTLVILENDLYRRSDKGLVDQLLRRSRQIVVIDHLHNPTTGQADILLPAATFAESEGTLVNNEGRAQRYYQALPDNGQVKAGWQWTGKWKNFDEISDRLASEIPDFSKLKDYKPDADYRMINAKIPRQTIRYSGRTAMNANISVSEPKIFQDNDSPLAYSMEGQPEKPPSSMVPFYWVPGWNSVQAMYGYLDEPNGSLKGGDPGIRLIEPSEGKAVFYFKPNQQTKEIQNNERLIVPVYRIFGSEELSSAASTLKQRITEPFILLNQADAELIGIETNDMVRLEISNVKLEIKVKIENNIKTGIAGLSVKLPGMPFIDLPGHGKLYKI